MSAEFAKTTAVTTSTTQLEVPGADLPQSDQLRIFAIGNVWINLWGGDGVVEGNNCIYIPAGFSRTIRWSGTLHAISPSGTVKVVCEVLTRNAIIDTD